LNFIFGIVCLFVCVCAFSLRRESPDMILGDKPFIFEVVLSQEGSRTTYKHISQFLAQVSDYGITDVHKIRLFPLSLSGTSFN
jgi:hypothetical protein